MAYLGLSDIDGSCRCRKGEVARGITFKKNIAPGIMESCVCKFTQMVQFSFLLADLLFFFLKTFQIFTLKLTTQTGVWMSQPPRPPPASRLRCTVECGLGRVFCPNLSESEKVVTELGPYPTVQARTETEADFVSRNCCCLVTACLRRLRAWCSGVVT